MSVVSILPKEDVTPTRISLWAGVYILPLCILPCLIISQHKMYSGWLENKLALLGFDRQFKIGIDFHFL